MASFLNQKNSIARETLTVSTVALPLTATKYVGTIRGSNQNGNKAWKARGAIVRVDTSGFGVRCTRDGTAPVAGTTGVVIVNTGTLPLPAGSLIELVLDSYAQICAFQMIREGASDAVVQVEYFV